MSHWLILVQMVLAGALAHSCFCRLVRTDVDTVREIRLAIWFQALAAGLVLGAPVLPIFMREAQWPSGTTPRWIWVVLLVSATLMQIVASRYWRNGIPPDFQHEIEEG
jgi:hypothetical protein